MAFCSLRPGSRPLGQAVVEQDVGLAVVSRRRPGNGIGAQRGELLEQRRRGVAGGVEADGDRHQLLHHRLVGGDGQHAGDVVPGGRAGVGRHGGGRRQARRLFGKHWQAAKAFRPAFGRLGRQFFNEEFDADCLAVMSGGFLGVLGELSGQHPAAHLGAIGKPRRARQIQIALGDGAGQVADAADVGGALGDRKMAPRASSRLKVGGLEHLLVGPAAARADAHQVLGLLFVRHRRREQEVDVGMLEVVGRLLDFVLVIDVAVGQAFRPGQVKTFSTPCRYMARRSDAVGDFAGDRLAVDAADLLEVGELRDFHAVHPDFPAQPQAPRVGFSQSSSTKRTSFFFRSKPRASANRGRARGMLSGAGFNTTTWNW